MPLTFDTSSVDKDKYPFIITDEENQLGHQNPVTETVIWMSLVTGSPARQKPEEFVKRALIWEQASGPMLYDVSDDGKSATHRALTPEELFDHAGVATNCTVLTPAEFRKRVFSAVEDRAMGALYHYRIEQREKADS